jgi:hypothetical protein
VLLNGCVVVYVSATVTFFSAGVVQHQRSHGAGGVVVRIPVVTVSVGDGEEVKDEKVVGEPDTKRVDLSF